MATPRVLFVSHSGTISGAELVLLDIVQPWREASAFLFEHGPLDAALQHRGLNVFVSQWGKTLSKIRRDSSPLKALPLAGRFAAIALEIARAARRHDVVYANSQKAFILAAIATAVVRKPLVWHLHDIIDKAHFGTAQRRLQVGLANRRAARVIVPSMSSADAFVAEGGRSGLVEVVPNGLEILPEDGPRARLRADLGLPAGPMVGVFSRLAAWKGQHVVLQALAKLPDVQCILAGDALFGEQAYAENLKELTSELGLGDRVRFLGQRHDVSRLMQAVDIMIHPSVNPEPFGRTLVEAMLAGVPVVATDAGASAEILDAGAAGTLVPPNDPDALVAAVARILARPEALGAQLDYAAARARTHYGLDQMRTAVSHQILSVAAGARA